VEDHRGDRQDRLQARRLIAGPLLISSDLPETVSLADRIAVMSDLRIAGEPANDHDCPRMSRRILRLIHAQTHVEGGVPAA